MNPARSPRFQSEAERCNSAAISFGGSPSGMRGAEQESATETSTTYDARRTVFPLLNVSAGASRGDAPAGWRSELSSGGVSSWRLSSFSPVSSSLPLPGLLGGFLFLLRLGLGRRARRLLHRHRRWRRRGRRRRREHRLHEPRSRPTAIRYVYVRLLKHRIISYADGAGASWVAYSLPRDSDLASDTDDRPFGLTKYRSW